MAERSRRILTALGKVPVGSAKPNDELAPATAGVEVDAAQCDCDVVNALLMTLDIAFEHLKRLGMTFEISTS